MLQISCAIQGENNCVVCFAAPCWLLQAAGDPGAQLGDEVPSEAGVCQAPAPGSRGRGRGLLAPLLPHLHPAFAPPPSHQLLPAAHRTAGQAE